MTARVDELQQLLAPVVAALGYELWGLELSAYARHSLLRVYIDSENGITVDDCAAVSGQVSSMLDVSDPITGAYTLEVSSPGWDRPLFSPGQFSAYVGEKVKVKLGYPVEGQRNCSGRLVAADGNGIVVEVKPEKQLTLPFAAIKKANLVIDTK